MTITVNAVTRRKQYTSTGSLGPYAFSFKILSATDIAVYVGSTKKTVTTHYTTAYNSDGTGSVTFTSGNAPASGAIVTLESAQAIERTSDYTTGGDFKAASINDDLDRLAINDQQLETNLTLNVQLASTANRDTSSAGVGPLYFPYADTASDQANKAIVYDSNGTALTTGPTASEISGAATQASNAATSATAAASSASTAAGHVTTASNYATKVDGAVTGSDYSSKAWAIGGTGVANNAKDYATKAEDSAVTGGDYSALHYAAKASASASSAASSATAAASGQIYSTVVNQTASTLSPALSADGTYYLCDTSSNSITVTLPAIGTSEGTKLTFQKTHASNSLIFQRSGSDTLNGSASNITLTDVDAQILFVSDNNSPDNWVGTNLNQIQPGLGLSKTGSVMAINTAVVKSVGKETIWIPAAAMRPTASNGCAAITDVETTSGRPDMQVLDFDASSDEHAQFQISMPKSWNEGTITYQVYWTTAATDTDGVAWGLQGVAVSDNDTIDVAYGSAVLVTDDALGAAEDLMVTAASSAVTIGGSPSVGDLCFFRIYRDVSDGNDDMAEDARLIGCKIFFTTDAGNDD